MSSLEPFTSPRARVFARLWAVALLAHVVGNYALASLPGLVGWTNFGAGAAALALGLYPSRATLMVASAACVASAVAEMPITGNHWIVAALVSLAVLVARARPEQMFPTIRCGLLVFYSFAAFAKLNAGFLDPSVSCGLHFVNQWLDGFGLPAFAADSWGGLATVWGPTLVELAVPPLLLWPPSRPLGVFVATGFHTGISYDFHQHFYDFTALLLPLFFLFVGDATAARIDTAMHGAPQLLRRGAATAFAAAGAVLVVAAVLPAAGIAAILVRSLPFVLWIPFSMWWLLTLVRSLAPASPLRWSLTPAGALIVAVAFLNGLTPYTEVKTAFGYNMYANLITVNGESNHYVIRRTLPLRDGHRDPVTIVATDDPGLRPYAEQGFLLPWPQFRSYLFRHPEVAVVYERAGARHEVGLAGEVNELAAAVPWWWRLLPLRAIGSQHPPRCQDVFLEAL